MSLRMHSLNSSTYSFLALREALGKKLRIYMIWLTAFWPSFFYIWILINIITHLYYKGVISEVSQPWWKVDYLVHKTLLLIINDLKSIKMVSNNNFLLGNETSRNQRWHFSYCHYIVNTFSLALLACDLFHLNLKHFSATSLLKVESSQDHYRTSFWNVGKTVNEQAESHKTYL